MEFMVELPFEVKRTVENLKPERHASREMGFPWTETAAMTSMLEMLFRFGWFNSPSVRTDKNNELLLA